MKVDMNRLMNENSRPPEKSVKLLKPLMASSLCLMLAAVSLFYSSLPASDTVSADERTVEPYAEEKVNPSFTVQQVGEVSSLSFTDGDIPVLTDSKERFYASMDETGQFQTVTEWKTLYADYETTWEKTDSITGMSFPGEDWVLKEIWFGTDRTSQNASDFLILPMPEESEKVHLTNNENHPDLSAAVGGYYQADEDGNYMVCIHDQDVIRLFFSPTGQDMETGAQVFDYDVSDGGYYLEDDYFHRKDMHATSGQENAKGTVYADMMECGIHTPENYEGDGAKLAFGADHIGSLLSEEFLSDGLDTLNLYNYARQEETHGTGVTRGLVDGVDENGMIRWNSSVCAPDLFTDAAITGKSGYTDGEYRFSFTSNGFSKVLSGVFSTFGDEVHNPAGSFWLVDQAPSAGTDEHDILWGDGSERTGHYLSGDRAPQPFPASGDGKNHNPFFGFSFTEDFVLAPGYEGPLDFFGYSGDDLWMFAAKLDENGNVLPDTCIPVVDLGGVHDPAGYFCNLWDTLTPVPYGEEAQRFRLFVFGLHRNGTSANCMMHLTLPEEPSFSEKVTGSLMIEAADFKSTKGVLRSFLADDGTGNCYRAVYDDGTETMITSGEMFSIPAGSILTVEGLTREQVLTITETGRRNVWFSAGERYEEGDHLAVTIGEESRVSFISAAYGGTLRIMADGEGTPDGGYRINLTLHDMGETEVSAMDGLYNPLGSRFTDADGKLSLTLAAGETLMLYNLPEGRFTLEPEVVPGFHLSEILLDDGKTEGSIVTGEFPAYVVYRYEENEKRPPQIALEQSVSGDWGTSNIVLGTGALLSYRVTVTNQNDTPLDLVVEEKLPEGVDVLSDSLPEGSEVNGLTVRIPISIGAWSVAEQSFTCQVTASNACELQNQVRILMDEEPAVESNVVTAVIPQ